jgi:hypothetical protein
MLNVSGLVEARMRIAAIATARMMAMVMITVDMVVSVSGSLIV